MEYQPVPPLGICTGPDFDRGDRGGTYRCGREGWILLDTAHPGENQGVSALCTGEREKNHC